MSNKNGKYETASPHWPRPYETESVRIKWTKKDSKFLATEYFEFCSANIAAVSGIIT